MKPLKVTKLLLIIFFAALSAVQAQVVKRGPQVLTFHSDVDDTEQPYACYIPQHFNPKKAYPLVVMLHGAGSNHRLAMRRVFGKSNAKGENDVEASLYFPEWKDVDYIVVAPYARGTMGYQGVAEKDVWDMIADVKSRFRIDADRTYLTGLSMGGGGTLWIGLTRPDFWAAIAPVCPAPPPGTEDYVDNALNYPVHFFQGGADPVVKPEGTRRWVENLKAAGSQVEYVEYPGVLHDSWVNAYENEFIFSWFSKFKRNPYPQKVRFSSSRMVYNSAYWVRLEEFRTGEVARIEATFTGRNRIDIKTSRLAAFSLHLSGHPSYKSGQKLLLSIDGQAVEMNGTASGEILKLVNNKWTVSAPESAEGRKLPGLEGPMADVVTDRHIYVYGTGGNPDKEEMAKRQAMAQKAADWSYYRGDFLGRVMVFPRVLSDREVRPNDIERSHLVLFGTPKTNTLIQRFSDQLPMQLKEDKLETHGLAYVFPVGKKYVLASSGLPWWELKLKDTNPFAALSTPGPVGNLGKLGDWVLFEKNNGIISGSSFDKNWKILPEESEKLRKANLLDVK